MTEEGKVLGSGLYCEWRREAEQGLIGLLILMLKGLHLGGILKLAMGRLYQGDILI
jgi:hypothetical protein